MSEVWPALGYIWAGLGNKAWV